MRLSWLKKIGQQSSRQKNHFQTKKIKQALNYNKLEEYLECLYYYINNINNIIIMGSAL